MDRNLLIKPKPTHHKSNAVNGSKSSISTTDSYKDVPKPSLPDSRMTLEAKMLTLMKENHQLEDKNRYQTVYAKHTGSAAAPTAGLHFTPELLQKIEEKGVKIARVTLHVGLGTFRPVKVDNILEHHMHSEFYQIDEDAAEKINSTKDSGKKVICVGTTSCRTIESAADEETGVLEIGPGVGVLTVECAKVAKRVVAIELDNRLKPVLAKTLADYPNAEVVFGDAMELDLAALIKEKFSDCKKVAICANLPYYITSPIIMKLLTAKLPIESITVMVQKEAGERLCAEVGSRDAGAVTVAVAYYANAQVLFEVFGIEITQTILSLTVVTAILMTAGILLGRNLQKRPGKLQVLTEKGVGMLINLVTGTMGEHNIGWVPFIGTIFLSSIFGTFIGLTGFLRSTTADLAVLLTWSVMVSVIIWAQNIKRMGLLGWLKGFTEPIVVMTPMNIISEIAQPFAMAFRHFGNVAGGGIITTILYTALALASSVLLKLISGTVVVPILVVALGAWMMIRGIRGKKLAGPIVWGIVAALGICGGLEYFGVLSGVPILQFGIPAVFSIYFDLFSGFVQAFVFTLLTMVYIAGACPPPEEENEKS
jgi:F0F1-type ATP synthase membrane subunit a/phospholipid N-methyltransferase